MNVLHEKGYTLRFIEQSQEHKKTKDWALWKDSKGCSDLLGAVHWRTGWRQYVFTPEKNTDWSFGCLEFVIQFLSSVSAQHKKQVQVK